MYCVYAVAQSCLTLCDTMGLPGSSVHKIFQARILVLVVISYSQPLKLPSSRTLEIFFIR